MIVEVSLSHTMYFSPGVGCRIIRKFPDGSRQMLRFGNDGNREWIEVNDLIAGSVSITMALEDDEAKMLLQELLNHYQGATDMHTVRADLIHERGRVDKMIEYLARAREQENIIAGKAVDALGTG